MAFKTNPWLEEQEKKHSSACFVIRLILSILVLSIGFLLFSEIADKSIPILMIIGGTVCLICTAFLKVYKE